MLTMAQRRTTAPEHTCHTRGNGISDGGSAYGDTLSPAGCVRSPSFRIYRLCRAVLHDHPSCTSLSNRRLRRLRLSRNENRRPLYRSNYHLSRVSATKKTPQRPNNLSPQRGAPGRASGGQKTGGPRPWDTDPPILSAVARPWPGLPGGRRTVAAAGPVASAEASAAESLPCRSARKERPLWPYFLTTQMSSMKTRPTPPAAGAVRLPTPTDIFLIFAALTVVKLLSGIGHSSHWSVTTAEAPA